MKVTVLEKGLGREINPFPSVEVYYRGGKPVVNDKWKAFDKCHPALPILSNDPLKVGNVLECEVAWQYRNDFAEWINVPDVRYDEFAFYELYRDDSEYFDIVTRQAYKVIEPITDSKKVKKATATRREGAEETIYLDINDFAISEQDLERAFAFGYLANPDNNCLDNVEMMRRYEIFKTQYLLPMLQRKHIID